MCSGAREDVAQGRSVSGSFVSLELVGGEIGIRYVLWHWLRWFYAQCAVKILCGSLWDLDGFGFGYLKPYFLAVER